MKTPRLYDFYPDGNEDLLIDTMKMLKTTGDPWEDVFKEEVKNLICPFVCVNTTQSCGRSTSQRLQLKTSRIRSLF